MTSSGEMGRPSLNICQELLLAAVVSGANLTHVACTLAMKRVFLVLTPMAGCLAHTYSLHVCK